ncbi:MAG: hypothetical protein EB060_04830 [Proteobacteria bacterium]|nr:hypothetical protein [Pseudomonadota bacterium]
MTVRGKQNLIAALFIVGFLSFGCCFFAGFLETQNDTTKNEPSPVEFKKDGTTKKVMADQKIAYRQREDGSIEIKGEQWFQIKSTFVMHAEWRTKDGVKKRRWFTDPPTDGRDDAVTEFRIEDDEILILTPETWYERKNE